jgi:hypothetical protein
MIDIALTTEFSLAAGGIMSGTDRVIDKPPWMPCDSARRMSGHVEP